MAPIRSQPIPFPARSASASQPTRAYSFAEESLRFDLEECSTDEDDNSSSTASADNRLVLSSSAPAQSHFDLAGWHRRGSALPIGPRSIAAVTGRARPPTTLESRKPTARELSECHEEERRLLRDNNIISPKDSKGRRRSVVDMARESGASVAGRLTKVFSHDSRNQDAGRSASEDAFEGADVAERAPLLSDRRSSRGGDRDYEPEEDISRKWEEAVTSGKIQTTWQREAKTLFKYSRSLVLAFLLQYSLTVASVFSVGHLGKVPLGAVSLASMSSNITGYAIYQGLATSLDTLCAQAYGSGKHKLVGLQLQRMVLFLCVCTIPIGIIWLTSELWLSLIIPDAELSRLAGLYLKILLLGAPGYAFFESGKRFMQAQGLFAPTLHILLVCAPLNALMNYVFVWKFGWGFIGAPIAVAVTDNLLAILLILYIRFIAGMECWGGFSRKALHNWGPMIRLALPGLAMVEAEFLAFEILTLAAAYFGNTHLAAQSVIATLCSITFQIPFPLSVAASTRIANLIGATLPGAARVSAKVALVAAACVGLLNAFILATLRNWLPRLFTSDEDVIALVAKVLPLVTTFQLFDALATNCNGILRGLGRQEIGGYVNLFCYYVVALPLSFGTAFPPVNLQLLGLWTGPAFALFLVAVIEGTFIYRADWNASVEAARQRAEAD